MSAQPHSVGLNTVCAEDITGRIAALRVQNRREIAACVTDLERLSPVAPALLAAMQPYLGHALVVGITGPPGAGKSTLVNAVVATLRASDKKVAVIAVDPSSPLSGGAILGDRIRMTAAHDDDGVYVRSLSSAGYLGGLSPAAVRIIDALDAAGFDMILLETVGAGQSEVDVAEVADVRVVVSAPGLGDDIQAMKSGLLEIADILVVNKGDRDGAEAAMHQLMGVPRAPGAPPKPVFKTTAVTGEGVPALLKAIATCGSITVGMGRDERRRKRARYLITRASLDLVRARLAQDGTAHLTALADNVLRGLLTPEAAALEIIATLTA